MEAKDKENVQNEYFRLYMLNRFPSRGSIKHNTEYDRALFKPILHASLKW